MRLAAALLVSACATVPPAEPLSDTGERVEAGRYCRADGLAGIDEKGPWEIGPSGVPMRLTPEEGETLFAAKELAKPGLCAGMPKTGPYRITWPAGRSLVRVAMPKDLTLDPAVQEPLGTQTLDLGEGVRIETFGGGTVLGRSFFESVGVRIDTRANELILYPPEAVHAEPDDESVSFRLDLPLPDTSHCNAVTWDFRHRTVWLDRENRPPPDLAGFGMLNDEVLWVAPIGPAAEAGLESHDRIVSIDGGTDFTGPLQQPVGTRVRITYRRGHDVRTVTLTLARWR
jgi:hypothetical protein